MENLNNSKPEEEIMRDIYKDYSDKQIFGMCKAGLLDAYDHGAPVGTPNPHNLESAYQLKRELERRKADKSMLEKLEEMEENLRKEYGM